MITITAVDALINDAFPIPDDSFEAVHRVQQLASVFEQLKKSYGGQRTKMMETILTSRIEDARFRIVHGFEDHVNLLLLQEKRFDIYERLVYLKASDAKEVLGERLLYDLCLETDEMFTREHSLLRSADLLSLLGKVEAHQFLIGAMSPAKARVIPEA